MRYTRLDHSPDYVAAREELRVAELELMEHVHAVAEQRRKLPDGPAVDDYVFQEGPADLDAGDAPARDVRLSELFTEPGRSLVVYQFMYGKAQTAPCPMCTMWIDGFNGVAHHVTRTTDFVVAAAADLPTLRDWARQRKWRNLRLLSCGDSTFKYDFGSEDEEGNQHSTVSVFARDGSGAVRHTYSVHPNMADDRYERGIDALCATWNVLDLTPGGRPDDWYPSLEYGPA
jgi:predicted dithiol-disulfide oxidoreductase (DUF899 family)